MKQSPSLILSLFTMFNLKSHLFGSLLHSKKVTVQIITFKSCFQQPKLKSETSLKRRIFTMLRDRQYIIDGGGF